ncbi:formate dehydrogenase subunit gamma [Variovorax terrae]|uniref:Formate dehydrogenase subunit gamma n=1 Tax=Variovorax terrae TaxID=2923278 RepID=A0A9X1VXF3_9BURK|nr:formate dehydrogenase subunit gamma [Variovorax terrae]MCJ0765177.1 formate dehydrogenase subunit gamma [Variovorax terrae]
MKQAMAAIVLVASSVLASAWAQSVAAPATDAKAPPAGAAPAAPAATGGIQGQNIFEVKPDASSEPNYASQTNAERAKVQPGNNAPMWRQVNSGTAGYSSLPMREAPEAGVLIQPFVQYPGSRLTNAGEAWRQVRNQWIIPYGGSLLLIVVVAIGLFYATKGPMALHGAKTGRVIERFTYFERAAHWVNAIAFSVLAISGLVMAFGKFFLQPVIGGALFGWLAYALKTLHNFAGPLFAVSLVVVFFTFLRDNLPRREDLTWLLKGGGMLSGREVPSHRFNAGEKLVFWGGVFALGIVVVGSGFMLDKLIPGIDYTRGVMQVSHMVHATATVLMMALFLGHIYLGTIGMDDAYQGMKTGYVDETWAREHHELWYDDIQAGRIPAQRSAEGAQAAGGAPVQV